jgi:hypothetical protein
MSCAAVRARLFDMPSHALCVCEGCCPRGGKGKALVKRLTARTLRREERREIEAALTGEVEGELTPLEAARLTRLTRLSTANEAVERYEKYLWR